MKNIIFPIVLLIGFIGFAQNEINYKAIVKDGGGTVLANQIVDVRFSILEGVAQTNVYAEDHNPTTNANGLIILNIGAGVVFSGDYSTIDWGGDNHFLNVQINTGSGLIDMGTTQFSAVPYALSAANVTGLEALDEGNGIGWRLKGRNSNNFGDLGINAIDLSNSAFPSTVYGATGNSSIAMGTNAEASGAGSISLGTVSKANAYVSTAFGVLNIGGGNPTSWQDTDPLFEIGNGDLNAFTTSNALTVLKNGTITAPSFDLVEITDNKALITKEYVDTSVNGLEALDEGNGSGWRLKGQNPTNYGNIGLSAVDLSYSDSNSTTTGALGTRSISFGLETRANATNSTSMGAYTIASGLNSVSMGLATTASGSHATAMGGSTIASGDYSAAMGKRTKAEALSSTTIGQYNIGGGDPTGWVETDPLFEVGNSELGTPSSNALTVLKNGKVGIGEHQPAAFLEIKANNSTNAPTVRLIHEGTTGARINFTNTDVTTGNYWTLYGDPDDVDANSVFNIFHPNAGNVLRLQGDGDIGIGSAPSYRLDVRKDEAADFVAQIYNTSTSTNADGLRIQLGRISPGTLNSFVTFFSGDGNSKGRIQGNNTGVTYVTTSDRRLKTNITDITDALSLIGEIQPREYEYKTYLGLKEYGFIAQELQPFYAQAVTGTPDSDVKKDPMMVDYGRLTPLLTAGIKELKNEVDTLKDEVGTLKKENADLKQKLNKLEQLEARLTAMEKTYR